MKSIVDRGSLTDLLITTLAAATGFPVGDAEMPPKSDNPGWSGEPNLEGSSFKPYSVLTPQTATASSGSFADPQDGWQLPYALASFGISRRQTEALANKARKGLRDLKGQTVELDGETYKIQQVHYPAIGGVGRVDATAGSSTFGEVDTVTVWLSQ